MASSLLSTASLQSQNSSDFMESYNTFFDDMAVFSHRQGLAMHDEAGLLQDQVFDNALQPSNAEAEVHKSKRLDADRGFSKDVFRASDMDIATKCVNGVQHFSSLLPSPPISPSDSCGDIADTDFEHGPCTQCQTTAVEKRTRRREQNRQSQRKFRARKEAKLSDAKARIASLEALVKAQEKTNTVLRLRIEQLISDSHSTIVKSQSRNDKILKGRLNTWTQLQETESCQDWYVADASCPRSG